MHDMTSAWPRRLLILGCGNMGGAMLTGWLRAGVEAARFIVVDPLLPQAPAGVRLLRDLSEYGGAPFDAILLGVKPQMLDAVAPLLAPLARPESVLLSILAGVELASLAGRFPNAGAVVRIMPNLAAAIGKSPMGLAGQMSNGQALDAATSERIATLLAPLGTAEWLAEESLLHAVTALGGSGPAFVYRFIDALAQGGAEIGLPPEQALRLALATVEGAAALAAASDHSPAELARRVASPGGTTEAGLRVLDAEAAGGTAITRLVGATLAAACDRSVEMAAAARAQS